MDELGSSGAVHQFETHTSSISATSVHRSPSRASLAGPPVEHPHSECYKQTRDTPALRRIRVNVVAGTGSAGLGQDVGI